jgi:hypothetical protein
MDNESTIISFHTQNSIQLKCEMDLQILTERKLKWFDSNWREFLDSDDSNGNIYERKGNKLFYTSEQLIPEEKDNRPPLLLVLGNPASHSVNAGMFFFFEAGGKEHRFWKDILKPAGVLDFEFDSELSIEELNQCRMEQLLNLDYLSDYRIGLCVFISMPSAASGSWSGVAGIQKLLGVKALRRLEVEETKRVMECAKEFITSGGAVVAFQKNAWNGLKSDTDPLYHLDLAKKAKLKGTLRNMPHIPLYCVPPTRLAIKSRQVLKKFLSEILEVPI